MTKTKIKYKIHRIRLDKATKELYNKLSRLNNHLERNSSRMSQDLKNYDKSKLYGVYAKSETGEILGWALLRFQYGCVFQIYVKKQHRQKGIGKKIWTHSKRLAYQRGAKRMEYYRLGTKHSYPFFSKLTNSTSYVLTRPRKRLSV